MTTPRTRSLVSLAALTLGLTLGACARNPSPLAGDWPAAVPERLRSVRFDNEAREPVYVYLAGQQREWLLGRVEPGARATLRLPVASMDPAAGFVRLAVLVGSPGTAAARDPRATVAIAQPGTTILSQRWTYSQSLSQGQLTPLPLGQAGRR